MHKGLGEEMRGIEAGIGLADLSEAGRDRRRRRFRRRGDCGLGREIGHRGRRLAAHRLIVGGGAGEGIAMPFGAGAPAEHASQPHDQEHGDDRE